MALGHWGARWIGSRLKRGQLDAGFLMWDMRRFVHLDEVPRGRSIVVHFRFTDARAGENRWWLVLQDGSASLCRDDPGAGPDVDRRVDRARADRSLDRRPRCGRGAGLACDPRQRRTARRTRAVALARPQRLRPDAGRSALSLTRRAPVRPVPLRRRRPRQRLLHGLCLVEGRALAL